jgi:L-2,4-diaminobutyric acid acetyltransferase
MSSANPRRRPDSLTCHSPDVRLGPPRLEDGRELWRIARDSRTLDLNSAYSYVLWCRDFAATSVVARADTGVCGFVTGYARPQDPSTLFVWQVAVDPAYRGHGLARRMLDHLADSGCRFVEATVTPDNVASDRLFTSFARDHGAALEHRPLLAAELFPGGHEAEVLYRIGPVGARSSPGRAGAGGRMRPATSHRPGKPPVHRALEIR